MAASRTTVAKAPLAVGDRAWCLILREAGNRSRSGARHTVEGAAQVVVIGGVGEVLRVRCVHASPEWMIDRELELPRARLHADADRVERRVFGELMARLWPAREIERTA